MHRSHVPLVDHFPPSSSFPLELESRQRYLGILEPSSTSSRANKHPLPSNTLELFKSVAVTEAKEPRPRHPIPYTRICSRPSSLRKQDSSLSLIHHHHQGRARPSSIPQPRILPSCISSSRPLFRSSSTTLRLESARLVLSLAEKDRIVLAASLRRYRQTDSTTNIATTTTIFVAQS